MYTSQHMAHGEPRRQAARQPRGSTILMGLPIAFVFLSCLEQSSESNEVWLCGAPDLRAHECHGRLPEKLSRSSSQLAMRAKAVGGPKGKRKDTKKQVQVQKERKKRDDVIELDGTVVQHSRNFFKVLLANGAEVQCTLAGKLRMNNIKVMEGDSVTVEMSPFDLTKGRIVFRTIKMPGSMQNMSLLDTWIRCLMACHYGT
ncbi:unnamed protein product [Effrenium voratum]|nr:unnamed protein product [Effrenium voratum]CAJ1419742.1 unnamed protein product [Effrenium voratum]